MKPTLSPLRDPAVFRFAVENAFNHIIITDTDGKIIYANPAVERLTGYNAAETFGKTPRLWGGQMDGRFYKKLWHTIKIEQKPFEGELFNRRKDGTVYYAKTVISPIFNSRKRLIGFLGTEEDVSKQKELDRLKSEFVSITAHQLKSPLTGVQWTLELLNENKHLPAEIRKTLAELAGVTRPLLHFVDNLLNITRIESGRLSFVPKQIDVADTVKEVLAIFREAFARRKQRVSIEISSGNTNLRTDPAYVREILSNLLSNAIKFTPIGGKITVSLEPKKTEILLSVSDNGYGIPEEDKQKIFSKYFRASNAVESGAEGNGLGLYFVKQLVGICRGRITFKSKERIGTTFTVMFPRKNPRPKKGEITLTPSQHLD